MATYTKYTFTNDTGNKTQVINANEMNSNFNRVDAIVCPIGTIIPFYDFNAALTFNADYWAYCDGSAKTIAGIGSQTLPDLSNRYLVGFGTEGGGDIDIAAWATAAVGAASHQVDLSHTHGTGSYAGPSHTHTGPSHSHTVDNHTHTISNHVHTNPTTSAGSAHSHAVGTLKFQVAHVASGGNLLFYTTAGADTSVITNYVGEDTETGSLKRCIWSGTPVAQSYFTKSGSGSTANESAHTHTQANTGNPTSNPASGGATPGTSANGTGATGASGTGAVTGTSASGSSATQSIQPRSIRVRFIMRIL